MVRFKNFVLDNGLQVIVHEDANSAVAVVNVMYDVGSRDEDEDKTGLAHLFEHLMFGGSQHIAEYDKALQQVGGDNNAYTTPDVTNYYCTLPAAHLETAFWLESDRMLGLSFEPKVLAVQQQIVIEEFKERYLNQPYGDVWLKLCDLAYTQHPYRWPTIGKTIDHIRSVTMEKVKAFFHKFYAPNNAVLVVAGPVQYKEVRRLSEKWFAPIPPRPTYQMALPQEPLQTAPRNLEVAVDVPLNALYKAYRTPGRLSRGYHAVELMTDILGGGKSSRLYTELVDTKQYFSTIDAQMTETIDPGLCIISGKLNGGTTFEEAEKAIQGIINTLQSLLIDTEELEKAKNQADAYRVFSAVDLLNRVQELAMATILGDTHLINNEARRIQEVTSEAIKNAAEHTLSPKRCTTIYYRSNTEAGLT